MKRNELIGFIAGGACLGAAIVILAINGGRPVTGRRNIQYFVAEVGKSAVELRDGQRIIGHIAEVWSQGGK